MYVFNVQGKSFLPDGMIDTLSDDEAEKQNRETSRNETRYILEEKPTKIFCYPQGDTITTWIGDVYGNIVERFPSFRALFGDERQNIRVKLNNGAKYYGTIYNSSYARLTMKGD